MTVMKAKVYDFFHKLSLSLLNSGETSLNKIQLALFSLFVILYAATHDYPNFYCHKDVCTYYLYIHINVYVYIYMHFCTHYILYTYMHLICLTFICTIKVGGKTCKEKVNLRVNEQFKFNIQPS